MKMSDGQDLLIMPFLITELMYYLFIIKKNIADYFLL